MKLNKTVNLFLVMCFCIAGVAVGAAEPKPPLSIGGSMDFKLYDVRSYDFAGTNQVFTLYPTYRFFGGGNIGNITGYIDIKKPGYSSATYPWLKVNQLYIKFTKDLDATNAISGTIGRQVVGDPKDLFLGFEGETIKGDYIFKPSNTEVTLFGARVDVTRTQNYTGLIGLVPTFDINGAKVSGYLISAVADGPYAFIIGAGLKNNSAKMAEDINLSYRGQVGGVVGSNNVSGFGAKVDGRVDIGKKSENLGLGSTVAFTTGANANATSTGFASPNVLTGAGPGFFSKLESANGNFTFCDALTNCTIIPMYAGIFNFGVNIDKTILNSVTPGIGLNLYSNTAANGKYLGTEIDFSIGVSVANNVSIDLSDAIFIPNTDSFGANAKSANRFEIGMLMSF
jgi:hypothetical protein